MYTKRELPLLIGRSKPVLSPTYPKSSIFNIDTKRPATEKTFTLSGDKIPVAGFGLAAIIIVSVYLLTRGR